MRKTFPLQVWQTAGLILGVPPSHATRNLHSDNFTASHNVNTADDVLFTGEWWTGGRGVDLGLVDAIGDLHATLRTRFGKDVELKLIGPKRPLFSLPRLGFSAETLTADLAATVEDRAIWARFGL